MCNHVLIQMVSIKEIRNKHTGLSEGYGFVEFLSHDVADNVLKKFNGTYMPNTDMPFRLNWASSSTGEENELELSIFVGNLVQMPLILYSTTPSQRSIFRLKLQQLS